MGGISQTYRRMDPVSVMAQGIATACDGRGLIKRAVNYTWALTPGGLESTSHDERFYKLPPYALDVGPYILTVAVTDSVTGDVSTATTALTVEPGDITAEITGGDTQIAMAGTITLDASASRDLDVPPGEPSGLAFSWAVDGTTYAGETVDVTLGAGSLRSNPHGDERPTQRHGHGDLRTHGEQPASGRRRRVGVRVAARGGAGRRGALRGGGARRRRRRPAQLELERPDDGDGVARGREPGGGPRPGRVRGDGDRADVGRGRTSTIWC